MEFNEIEVRLHPLLNNIGGDFLFEVGPMIFFGLRIWWLCSILMG
jgi:hypothetical protein